MLDQESKDWIDARYVRKEDCNDIQKGVSAKLSNDDTRIKLFEQQMATWNKLFWAIASATIGQLVLSVARFLGG